MSDFNTVKRLGIALAVLSLSALFAPPASANPFKQFLANLNAGQALPPNTSTGFGVAHFTFDEANKMLCYAITYTGLTGPEIVSHIHGPGLPGDQVVPPGGAPVLFPLPITNPKNGCVGPLDNTTRANLLRQKLYVNIHTAANPGGEIHGQILRIK